MLGADAFLRALRARNTTYLFGLPGTTEAAVLRALAEDEGNDLRFVLTLHEGAAIGMADGYARVTGGPGVASLHTSVGTLAGLSMLYNSWRDGVPVVVTACHKSTRILGRGGFSTVPDMTAQVRPLVKWSHQTYNADQIGDDTERAFQQALAPPVGPTFLVLPEDLLAAPTSEPPSPPRPAQSPVGPDDETVADIARRLLTARRPVLLVGTDVARTGAGEAALKLAEAVGLPVLWELRRQMIEVPFSPDHPHYVGMYSPNHPALEEADLLVAVGATLFVEFQAPTGPEVPDHVELIHVHRDASQIGKLYRPAVGVQSDAKPLLEALLRAVAEAGPLSSERHAERMAAARQLRDGWQARQRSRMAREHDEVPMAVSRLAAELGRALPENSIVFEEAVRSSPAFLDAYPLRPGKLHRTGGGALGWGVPAAFGGKLARPDAAVVAVVGDGCLHFTPQAIWTGVQQRLPVVIVVLNNGKYLAVKAGIETLKGVHHDTDTQPGYDIGGIDHAQVARGYGALAAKVDHPDEFSDAVREALQKAEAAGKPFLLDVAVREERPGEVRARPRREGMATGARS